MKNSFFNTMMNNYKHHHNGEDGIHFAKEGFNQLFDEYSKELNNLSKVDTNNFRKGLTIGTVVGGLTVVAIVGVKKYVNRRKKHNMIIKDFERTVGEFVEYVNSVESGDLKIDKDDIVH